MAALKDWVTAVFVIAGIVLRLLEEEKMFNVDLAGYEGDWGHVHRSDKYPRHKPPTYPSTNMLMSVPWDM